MGGAVVLLVLILVAVSIGSGDPEVIEVSDKPPRHRIARLALEESGLYPEILRLLPDPLAGEEAAILLGFNDVQDADLPDVLEGVKKLFGRLEDPPLMRGTLVLRNPEGKASEVQVVRGELLSDDGVTGLIEKIGSINSPALDAEEESAPDAPDLATPRPNSGAASNATLAYEPRSKDMEALAQALEKELQTEAGEEVTIRGDKLLVRAARSRLQDLRTRLEELDGKTDSD